MNLTTSSYVDVELKSEASALVLSVDNPPGCCAPVAANRTRIPARVEARRRPLTTVYFHLKVTVSDPRIPPACVAPYLIGLGSSSVTAARRDRSRSPR